MYQGTFRGKVTMNSLGHDGKLRLQRFHKTRQLKFPKETEKTVSLKSMHSLMLLAIFRQFNVVCKIKNIKVIFSTCFLIWSIYYAKFTLPMRTLSIDPCPTFCSHESPNTSWKQPLISFSFACNIKYFSSSYYTIYRII